MNDDTMIIRRVLALPQKTDKYARERKAILRSHRQKRHWPVPKDASLILNLHFKVTSFDRQSWVAEANLELPVTHGVTFRTTVCGAKTRKAALRRVISQIENTTWFNEMKQENVYFKVTGERMDELYHGYL